ncbi:hypothetical protein LCGC14_1304300 [marine sediment metagenome]|uniref:Uncharacterized protein n=1 Tax=marine sediment metagenome TaxID=412755 RepID=A0A0F9L913_9ZZZZ
MNKPAVQATPKQVQEHQRALRAIQRGMQYLLDETVTGPMKHSDGVADLKWLLRKLMSGEWGLNMDPKRGEGLTTDQKDLKQSPDAAPKVPSTPIAGLPAPQKIPGGNGSK